MNYLNSTATPINGKQSLLTFGIYKDNHRDFVKYTLHIKNKLVFS